MSTSSGSKLKQLIDKPLSITTKLIYGSGDWGRASFNTLRQFFYAIFLTDVVGLDPRLASFAALVSIIWDAINDPLVGALSDNVRTKWGRRRPFMLIFSIPFALAFVLMWWAPPWQSQIMLMVHVTLAYMVSDTIQTLVTVPYLSLTPEIAKDYDERTSLTSFRMFFNLVASVVTAVAAPAIMDSSINSGLSMQQAYLTISALFGGLAVVPFILIFIKIKEKDLPKEVTTETHTFRETINLLWQNTPFRYATGIYVLNWISFDIEGLMLPFFLLYVIARGNLLEKVNFLGINLALESAVFGLLLITATITIPIWNWMSKKYNKKTTYIIGMIFWIVIQIFFLFIMPGQIGLIMILAVLAGISVSNAHVMPESIFPDVIDWDELRTNTRREGMYYGAIYFIRKLSSAIATFLALQLLGWFGYQAPPVGVTVFVQPIQVTWIIRVITGPFIALLLIGAVCIAWFYPLSRDRQKRIQRSLQRRKKQQERLENKTKRRY